MTDSLEGCCSCPTELKMSITIELLTEVKITKLTYKKIKIIKLG